MVWSAVLQPVASPWLLYENTEELLCLCPVPRRLQRGHCFDLILASRCGWLSWHSSRNRDSALPRFKAMSRKVKQSSSVIDKSSFPVNIAKLSFKTTQNWWIKSIYPTVLFWGGILVSCWNPAETREETWAIILEVFILQVEVACLTSSFVKILTIVYYKNLYSVFYINLEPLDQVFWKGLPNVIYFNLLIREILGRANCSGPCRVKYFVSPRMGISQLSEQLAQCLIMFIVIALFPYQFSFLYSKLRPLSLLLQYISHLCFLFQTYVFHHLKALWNLRSEINQI